MDIAIRTDKNIFDGLFGKIQIKNNKLCLQIIFDEDIKEDLVAKTKIYTYISFLRASNNNFPIHIFLNNKEIMFYTSSSTHFVYEESNQLVITNLDPILTCTKPNKLPNYDSMLFDSLSFKLKSNKNKRTTLTKHMKLNLKYGIYIETGNQYTRNVTINFSENKKYSFIKEILQYIIVIRTFIDGFQNYESNIEFVSNSDVFVEKYISRRKIDKYRWFKSARLNNLNVEHYRNWLNSYCATKNKVKAHLCRTCEYLHTPDMSMPKSKFFELISALEEYMKSDRKLDFIREKSCNWVKFKKNIKYYLTESDFSKHDKSKIKDNLYMLNPSRGHLSGRLENLVNIISEKHLFLELNNLHSENFEKINLIRNKIAHGPSSLYSPSFSNSDLVHITIFLREISILYLLISNIENYSLNKENLGNVKNILSASISKLNKMSINK